VTGRTPPRRGVRGLLVDVSPLRLDREYRLLWSGQAISAVGNHMTRLALPYQVYVLTGSTLAIGALALVQLIPIVVVVLAAGAIADAFDRRRVLIATNVGMVLSSAFLLVLALQSAPALPMIYLAAFLLQSFSSIDQPTRLSAIPRLVPRSRLQAALALNTLFSQGASVAGPALAGVLLATVGPAGVYAADVASFIPAFAAVVALRPIPPLAGAIRPGIAAVREGFAVAARRRVILSTFVIDLDAMIFGMPTALFPVLALDVFKVGPAGVGFLGAAPAVGALVAATFSGWMGRIREMGRATYVVVAIWGVAITLFGLATFSFPLALLFLAVAGAADILSTVFRNTIVQHEAPDEVRGRISSMHVMVVRMGPRLGDMEAAAVASAIGAQGAVVSGGILCLLGLGLVARAFPELARYAHGGPEAARTS
jgi:MFS family permease